MKSLCIQKNRLKDWCGKHGSSSIGRTRAPLKKKDTTSIFQLSRLKSLSLGVNKMDYDIHNHMVRN